MSCAPNIDFNAGVIDSWDQQTYKERQERQRKDKEWQTAMKRIRRTHICSYCNRYPGDEQYTFGSWNNNRFYCFEHIPL